MSRSLLLSVALAAASCGAGANDAPATITIMEGSAIVYRGTLRSYAVEGIRLAAGDIVETADSSFAQIEFADRSVLQFGPATRAMLQPARARGTRQQQLVYVLQGWVKIAYAPADAKAPPAFDVRAPLFELAPSPGVIVVQASPAEATMFAERGGARVGERQARGASVAVSLNPGEFYQRKSGAAGAVIAAAPREFIDRIPRHFRDSLPARIDKFQGQDIKPKEAPVFGYADVEAWLKSEPEVRRQFVQRWRGKSREPAFRSALVANLSSHPEWDPILFPEKYLPKEPKKDVAPATPSPIIPPPVRQ